MCIFSFIQQLTTLLALSVHLLHGGNIHVGIVHTKTKCKIIYTLMWQIFFGIIITHVF